MGAEATFLKDVSELCADTFKQTLELTGLRRLTGGANMETWAFSYGDKPLILRRRAALPDSSDEREPMALVQEAAIIERAGQAGVIVPKVFASTGPDHALGETILMERMGGEALPQKLFRDPAYRSGLAQFVNDSAVNLARIHAVPTDTLFAKTDAISPAEAVERRWELYQQYGGDSPIQAYAFKWLRDNLPEDTEPTLCHGDFRMGNILVDETGISGVLDWELAHLGDPISDLGYLCAPCWRFGNYDQPVGGVGQIEDLITRYERESGRLVDPNRFRFWMIFASLNWSVICMTMVDLWRTGTVRELERAVIGTRVSESEIDLLLMLEEMAAPQRVAERIEFAAQSDSAPAGDTKPEDLSKALAEWVTEDLLPSLEGREQFKARVARNALGILERQATLGPKFRQSQQDRLAELNFDNAALSNALLSGSVDLNTPGILTHLRRLALEKVSIDQPKYAGLKIALGKWSPS